MAKAKKETLTSSKTDVVLTAAQLEHMTTHELAGMLSNIVMLLRRMPDVPCGELVARQEDTTYIDTTSSPVASIAPLVTESAQEQGNAPSSLPLEERITELEKKHTIPQLKAMADELGIPYPVKPKKAELAKRIAERQARGHSEQYAMMNL